MRRVKNFIILSNADTDADALVTIALPVLTYRPAKKRFDQTISSHATVASSLFKKTCLASECVSNQIGVADSQGLGKQEKHKRKLKSVPVQALMC